MTVRLKRSELSGNNSQERTMKKQPGLTATQPLIRFGKKLAVSLQAMRSVDGQ
jgi:hypothetical protein